MAFSFGKISSAINNISNVSSQIKSLTSTTNRVTPSNVKGGRFNLEVGTFDQSLSTARNLLSGAQSASLDANGLRTRAGAIDNAVNPLSFLSNNNPRGSRTQSGNLDNITSLLDGAGGLTTGAAGKALGPFQNMAGGQIQNINQVNQDLTAISGFANNLNVGLDVRSLSNLTSGALNDVAGNVTTAFSQNIRGIAGNIGKKFSTNLGSLNNLTNFLDINDITKTQIVTIPFDRTDIISAFGESYSPILALRSAVGDLSNLGKGFVDNTFNNPFTNRGTTQEILATSGDSASKVPNPLRDHNHYNYIITLGLLDPNQFNNPSLYRSSGKFDKFIVRSSGGGKEGRYQTYDEVQDNTHAEYFIDNLDFNAVLSPNSKTGPALGTTISFEVTEPFSMGNFIQAVTGIAKTSGYANYLDAPFALKIDFVGWDEEGATDADFVGNAHWVPIKMTKMDFRVDGSGSKYQIEAIAYSETGLGDAAAKCKSPIKAKGDLVYKVLNGEEDSVTSAYNNRVTALEDEDTLKGGDRFIVAFPKDPNDLVKTVESNLGGSAAETDRIVKTVRTAVESGDPRGERKEYRYDEQVQLKSVSKSALLTALQNFARDQGQMNLLGLSVMRTNNTAGANTQAPKMVETYNENDEGTADRSNIAVADRTLDVYSFEKATRIDEIIEKVLLDSDQLKELATRESKNGTKEWFRIDTKVFIDNDPVATEQLGRPPRIYVYSVIPYFHDESKVQAPTEKPTNIEGLKKAAVKQYDYIYTGKNEDVINVDLQFNMAFMQTAFANYGNNTGAQRSGTANRMSMQNNDEANRAKPAENKGNANNREAGKEVAEKTRSQVTSGSRDFDVRQKIAEMFNDMLNYSSADMLSVELNIWGDPFFIPQQTGNYTGRTVGNPNMTENGTVQYLTNQVYCVLNFLTPFDYQVNGATMEMPRIVPEFSGLYVVTQVSNKFSSGQFTQTLTMYRKTGQADEPTDNNKGAVVTDSGAAPQTGPGAEQRANSAVNNQQGGTNCDNIVTVPESDEIIDAYGEDFSNPTPIISSNTRLPGTVSVGEVTYSPFGDAIFANNSAASKTVSAVSNANAQVQRAQEQQALNTEYTKRVQAISSGNRRLGGLLGL